MGRQGTTGRLRSASAGGHGDSTLVLDNGRLRSASAGGMQKPVQLCGAVRPDMRRLIFCGAPAAVRAAFQGALLWAQRLGSVVLRRAEKEVSGRELRRKVLFSCSRRKFFCE